MTKRMPRPPAPGPLRVYAAGFDSRRKCPVAQSISLHCRDTYRPTRSTP